MARMRSLKPEYWDDEELATATSRDARLLYVGLWNLADEHSRLRGDPRFIKGKVFAYDDDLTPPEVDLLLDELARAGKVVRYRVGGARFLHLPKLAKHQRLEPEKVPSRLPGPDEGDPDPPPPPPTQIRPDESARRADEFAQKRTIDEGLWDTEDEQPERPAQIGANKSARGANSSALKHVAGSREHVAGSRVPPAAAALALAADATDTQRSKRITDAYAAAQPMCRWPAINGVVLKAIRTGRYSDREIHAALMRLAAEGRSVTVESLRIEIEGLTPRASPTRPSTTDQRMAMAKAAGEEAAAIINGRTA